MINLIPNTQKKKMIKSFYYRLVVIFFLALSFSVLIGVTVMIPSYFIISYKQDAINKKLDIQNNQIVSLPDKKTLDIIKDLDYKLNLIENAKGRHFDVSSKVINPIILKKIPSIKITHIFYTNDLTNGRKIKIEGIAPSREILLSFRLALQDDVAFKNVDLPISNFIKGSNIQFSLNLIPS